MIRDKVLEQRARAAGLDKDPEFQRQIRKLLIGKLREQELNTDLREVKVTEEEIKAEYQKHLDEHARPAKIRLAMLFLKIDPKMGVTKVAELRDQLNQAREQISKSPPPAGRGVATKGFGSLAISNSEDQASRYRGGDIGWLDVDKFDYRWPREVLTAGYALKDHGDFSEVIEASNGLYVVMKVDSREKVMTPLADVEKGIKHRLILQKREELESSFEESMENSVPIKINREALASVVVPKRATTKSETQTPPTLQ
jgi:parvulin-like peptidyl-prolyl isomerase